MYIYKQPALITEDFLLPSGGKLYGEGFDGHLTLRAMTTIEERMRTGSENYYATMSEIVNRCIVDNVNPDGSWRLDSKRFTIFDFDAICVKLRIISYGPMYKTRAICTMCEHEFDYKADLRDCEFNFLPDDFVEPYPVGPLPSSGDTLGCRFLRVQDKIDIEKKAQEILAKDPKYIGKPEFELTMLHRIVTINGEEVDSIMGTKYIENMISMDVDYYQENVDTAYYGVNRVGFTDCINVPVGSTDKCGGKAIYFIRSDSEFFRAKSNY